VNIRIVSATNRNLEQMVRDGRFRSDLYFRLRVISLSMPPLRKTGEDILRIAEFYLHSHASGTARRDCASARRRKNAYCAMTGPGT